MSETEQEAEQLEHSEAARQIEVEQIIAERDAANERAVTYSRAINEALAERDTAQASEARLRRALDEYAAHLPGCGPEADRA